MCFEKLSEAAERNELICVDGGMCHYHIRRDRQLTIHEIIVEKDKRNQGIGSALLDRLKAMPVYSILAKCPADLASNQWYKRSGFVLEQTETTPTGRLLNVWRLYVAKNTTES